MKTARQDISLLGTAVFLSMLLNVMLFSFQPMISRITSSGYDLDRLIPVKIINYSPEPDESLAPRGRPEARPDPLEIDEITPAPLGPDMEFRLPKTQFSINPMLSTGMPVAVPDMADRNTDSMPNAFGLADVDQPPAPLFQLKPDYPYSAKRSNTTGKVSVMFLVDRTGKVLDVRILSAEPEGVFEDSVRSALAKWKFVPGKLRGRNVQTWVATTIRFELD
jgi:protein TonB